MDIPFTDLPAQTTINLRADAYGKAALQLSRLAVMTTRCMLDQAYGTEPFRRLDIYMPATKQSAPVPVFVGLHGGGFTWGYKEWMGLNAPAITAFPAIFVSIDYRLVAPGANPVAMMAGQLDDTAAAVAWVYANIARFGGDPERITIGGHSAGARLSALLAVRRDVQAAHGIEGKIRACLPVSGSYDDRDPGIYGEKSRAGADTTSPEDNLANSPLAHIKDCKIPFYVTWGENDNTGTKSSSPAFITALRRAGCRAEGHMFPLFDHFWIHIDQQRDSNLWTRTLRAWMLGDAKTEPLPA